VHNVLEIPVFQREILVLLSLIWFLKQSIVSLNNEVKRTGYIHSAFEKEES